MTLLHKYVKGRREGEGKKGRREVKGRKVGNAFGHFVFFENQKMNDEKSIEGFLADIDCDLLQYVGEFRKKVFTFNIVCAVSCRRRS